MCVAGMPETAADHCETLARFALAAISKANATLVKGTDDPSLGNVSIRCGMHTGRCIASVVGQVAPRFVLFGEAVTMAARLESHGECFIFSACTSQLQVVSLEPPRHALNQKWLPSPPPAVPLSRHGGSLPPLERGCDASIQTGS